MLEPYVLDLVNRTIDTYSKRYGFELKQPVIVELYPDHDDFAVRIAGLPGIGLLGVTFGYLVAMDSPTGRADDDFHWGTTLWHEMAHVFTLEATNHLVPRWFSEGVSVYEEWSTGPLPGRHIPLPVFAAIKEDKFLPVAELDRGFIRPTYEAQVIVSYMQAGLICEYIAGRFGQEALERMLDEFAAARTRRKPSQARARDLAGAVRREFRGVRRHASSAPSSRGSSAGRRSKPSSSKPSRAADWRLVGREGGRGDRALPRLRRRRQRVHRQGARASRARRDGAAHEHAARVPPPRRLRSRRVDRARARARRRRPHRRCRSTCSRTC